MARDSALSPLLVGRGDEMRLLRCALEESLVGSGRVILLVGEPGIGKTRTAQELAAHAGRTGIRVLTGRCHDGEPAPAYWPWIQIVRAYTQDCEESTLRSAMGTGAADIALVVPDVAERLSVLPASSSLGSPEARFRFFDSMVTFFKRAAHTQPLVVFLDDLHCADVASLLLLRFLVRESAEARLLIIGTYRDTDVPIGGTVREALEEIARPAHALQLRLHGLDDEAVAHLMEQLTGMERAPSEVARVRHESGGNPFFVIELVRLLASEGAEVDGHLPLPDSVQEVIRRRLARLSPVCSEMLKTAAVIGREFDGPVLARASGVRMESVDRALDEAVTAHLIVETATVRRRFQFRHALVREAVYRMLDPESRIRLHQRIGELLEDLHAAHPEPHLAELAHHFLEAMRAGKDDRGIAYAERAARRALVGLAYEEAAAHYARAITALEFARPGDAGDRCELLLGLGGAHVRAGDTVRAREVFQEAAEIATAIGASQQLARAALGYGARSDPLTVNVRLIAMLDAALRAVEEHDSALRCRLMARLARELGPNGAAIGVKAVEMATRLGDPAVLTTVLIDKRFALWGPDNLEERFTEATEILRMAEATGARETALAAHLYRVIDLLELGRTAAVDRELEVLTETAEDLRQPWYVQHAAALRAMRARLDGRYEDAERFARYALEVGLRVKDRTAQTTYAGHRLDLCRERGGLLDLEADVRRFAAEYPGLGLVRYVPPWLYAELGREAQARREIERLAAHDFTDISRDMNWLAALVVLSEAVAVVGDVARAAALYALLRAYAERVVVAGFGAICFGSASLYLGRLATTLANWEVASLHLEAAIDANRRLGAMPCVARSQHAYAVMLQARNLPGDVERALELWRAALDTAQALGMTRLAAQAQQAIASCDGSAIVVSAQPSADTLDRGGDNLFRWEGDYWTIAYEGTTLRVRDTRGVRYLAQLVSNPGRELLAADLVSGCRCDGEGTATSLSDGGDVLDARAVAAYRGRLDDLRDTLQDARRFNDLGRATEIECEMRALVQQLAHGLGLGGRRRRAGSLAERARLNVRKGIDAVLRKLAEQNPALGRHLTVTVRTGTFCSYNPDPRVAISWRVLRAS